MFADPACSATRALLEAEQYLDQRDIGVALARFNAAEALGADPDRCSGGRWITSMLSGDFARAWRESDAIRQRGTPDPHRFWNGEDIRGRRLILRCLHGFGDAVQFLRYAPALRELAAEVIFEVGPRLMELARCFDGAENVITWGQYVPREALRWDVQMEVMELPYFFRTELNDLPIAESYLRLPPRAIARVEEEMGRKTVPRIGLVWSAGEWNPSRCAPFLELEQLLQSTDCEFWNLQGSGAYTACKALREVEGCRHSILTLAGVISRLDLVITVDTLAAHLAGALGVPAWVMLQYAADWRWMTGTSRSPWYPSLRLFRQQRQGDWAGVVAEVRLSLDAWSNRRRARLIAL